MVSENEQLAVASKAFRWIPGMLHRESGGRVLTASPFTVCWWGKTSDGWGYQVSTPAPEGATPDFDDPATRGCLLALVREAWGDPLLHIEPEPIGIWRAWHRVTPRVGNIAGEGATEVAAMVAALVAAPEVTP